MQYRIKGYDQEIEAKNPHNAASQYLRKFYNIEIAKPYATIYNGTETSDDFDDWFDEHMKYVVEDVKTKEKYLVDVTESYMKIEMSPIVYVKGDATEPVVTDGFRIITHICNDKGAWGAGFVLALSRKWKEPEAEYRKLKTYELGNVQFVQVNENTIVANIIGQHCTGTDENGNSPIRYNAVRNALKTVNSEAIKLKATIHSPYMGCGLAGGIWGIMEAVILETITVPMYIYEF